MPLTTPALIATLKAAIAAETDAEFVALRDAGATGAMSEWFNVPSATSVWGTAVPVGVVQDAIDYTAYTPNGTIDATAAVTNRLLAAQTKQMNLQLMLQGRDSMNSARSRTRASLLDAVTGLPTGTAGAPQSAGGADGARVLNALTRAATRGEKLFIAANATTGTVTASLLVYEGQISNGDIAQALAA